MKKMLLIAMISLGVLSCKKDQNDPEPQVCGYITDFGIDEGGTYIIIDDQTKDYRDISGLLYNEYTCN